MSNETKAARLFRQGNVTLAQPIYFLVQSPDDEGRVSDYNVTIRSDGQLNCTCQWGTTFPGSTCSHTLACNEFFNAVKLEGDNRLPVKKKKVKVEKKKKILMG